MDLTLSSLSLMFFFLHLCVYLGGQNVLVVVEEEGPERRDPFNENCDISPSLTSRN